MRYYFYIGFFVLLVFPAISNIIIKINTKPTLENTEFKNLNMEINYTKLEDFNFNPTFFKNFNNKWISRKYYNYQDSYENNSFTINSIIAHTADSNIRIKGLPKIREGYDNFKKKYPSYSSYSINSNSNIYLYKENKFVAAFLAADDYFVLELELNKNIKNIYLNDLNNIIENFQQKRNCLLLNKWYKAINFTEISSSITINKNICKNYK